MSCGMQCIKYFLFFFNFIVALSGLAIVSIAALGMKNLLPPVGFLTMPFVSNSSWTMIVIGSIIFVIAFLGCCGAIRESHWMSITYAIVLLTLLVVQVAVAIYLIVNMKEIDETFVDKHLREIFNSYNENPTSKTIMNDAQTWAHCCGVDGYQDFSTKYGFIPGSCCGKKNDDSCTVGSDNTYTVGCKTALYKTMDKYGKYIGIAGICLGGIELFGVIFSLCLANSIKNKHRRGYEV